MVVVGVYLHPSKKQKLNLNAFKEAFERRKITFRELSLETVETVDVLLHKINPLLESNDERELAMLKVFEQISINALVIDPLSSVRILCDRRETISRFVDTPCLFPKTVYTREEALKLNYPIIIKSISACNTKESHNMKIIYSPSELEMDSDKLAQEYIEHEALIKVYVVNNFYQTVQCDYTLVGSTFNTHAVKKSKQVIVSESKKELVKIANTIRKTLNMRLFNFDTFLYKNRYYVIDVNFFPDFPDDYYLAENIADYIEDSL